MAKIVTDPKGKLLGAAIVGPHAGELIAEYVMAIAKGMNAKDLTGIIHAYPTLAQINRRVADQRLKEGLTPTAKTWIRRLFRLQGVREDALARDGRVRRGAWYEARAAPGAIASSRSWVTIAGGGSIDRASSRWAASVTSASTR